LLMERTKMRWIIVVLVVGIVALIGVHWFFTGSYTTPDIHSANPATATSDQILKALAQIVISAILIVAALFVVLSKRYTPTDKHWAYGTIGTLVGFWLKSS